MRVALVRLVLASTLLVQLAMALPAHADGGALDHALPDGHFYQQANGQGGQGDTGYAITDADGIPFWSEYQRLGGPGALGYPASRRFTWDGFTVQVMQKVVFQWHPDTRQVAFVNVLDRLHDLGKDGWLLVYRQTPRPADTAADIGLSWPQVEQHHWGMLDTNAAIKARYWADSDPVDHLGLPMAAADMGNNFVVRAQRGVFQYWKVNVPWAKQGEVTIANAGDLAKEAGLFSGLAVTPELQLVSLVLKGFAFLVPFLLLLVFPAVAAAEPAASLVARLDKALEHWENNVLRFLAVLLLTVGPAMLLQRLPEAVIQRGDNAAAVQTFDASLLGSAVHSALTVLLIVVGAVALAWCYRFAKLPRPVKPKQSAVGETSR